MGGDELSRQDPATTTEADPEERAAGDAAAPPAKAGVLARIRAALTPVTATALALALVALVLGAVSLVRTTTMACSAADVADRTMPSVVTIFVTTDTGRSNGSGSFIDEQGHVLTNNHVISPAAAGGRITVQRPNGELPATLVGRDNATDLAVLKVEPETDYQPIGFGGSLGVGDRVFAIGAPLGLTDTITSGVVGALGRSVRVPADNNTTALITSAIQTDAAINPGNSGGVLADCDGRLVGVPTAGATATDSLGQAVSGSIGLGFAIPVDFARRIADALIADGRVRHADAGMAVAPVGRGSGDVSGLYVIAVTPGGAAEQAGLQRGDVITELDGDAVSGPNQLQRLLLTRSSGDTVTVTFERAGAGSTVTLTLG